jgi:hypothetical protein
VLQNKIMSQKTTTKKVKTKTKNFFPFIGDIDLIVVTITTCVPISNHHIVHLECI